MYKNSEKLPMRLLDPYFVEGVVKVLDFGVQKYYEDSWKEVAGSKFLEAAERHLLELKKGYHLDPESGLPHTHHVAANMMILDWHTYRGGEEDVNATEDV